MNTNKIILNLTQHPATPEQVEAGVVDLPADSREEIKGLLTFEEIPTPSEIEARASSIAARIALWYRGRYHTEGKSIPELYGAMIGGAPYLMPELERKIANHFVVPVYAFSRRESSEKVVDGEVVKTSKFVHLGFVKANLDALLKTIWEYNKKMVCYCNWASPPKEAAVGKKMCAYNIDP